MGIIICRFIIIIIIIIIIELHREIMICSKDTEHYNNGMLCIYKPKL